MTRSPQSLARACGLLAALVPANACSPAVVEPAGDGPPPNFVVILADDVGWSDVGYNGAAWDTPHLDALARDGMVFTHFYAAAPSCSPTRASLLTGQHPARLGLTRAIRLGEYFDEDASDKPRPHAVFLQAETRNRLPEGTRTFPERLAEAGYRTAFIGKWHLGSGASVPRNFGFTDARAVGLYPASSYFPPYHVGGSEDAEPGEYLTDYLTERALEFLREAQDGPFLLYLSHFAVHGPWEAKPELVEHWAARLDPTAPQGNATYAAMVHSLDESVGRLLAELERLGLAERTVVVFTSDNGGTLERKGKGDEPAVPLTTNGPLRGGKLDGYEGGLRVPAVVRAPGSTRAGEVVDTPVISTDLYPTLLALAGLELGEGEAPDGVELRSLWEGDPRAPALQRGALFFHVPHRRLSSAIRRGPWKLLHRYNGPNELYRLDEDPGETRDLVEREAARAAALEAELFRWLADVGARMPRPNPDRVGEPEGPGEHGD